jgi:hypothetical protein
VHPPLERASGGACTDARAEDDYPHSGSSVFAGRRRSRRLVFRPSTRAEIADIFPSPEWHGGLHFAGLGHLAVDLFEV